MHETTPPHPTSRFRLPALALTATLGLLLGCPESSTPPAPPPAPAPAAQVAPDAQVPDPAPAPVPQQAEAQTAAPASRTSAADITLVAADKPYVTDAGRSPIPEPGENITKPLPYDRLAKAQEGVAPPEGQAVSWQDAPQHLGHVTIVEGKIVGTFLLRSGNICFLNFKDNDRTQFYIAMFKEAFEGMPQKPDAYYLGKTIRVTGRVSLHKGRPQIQVHDAGQIEVIE